MSGSSDRTTALDSPLAGGNAEIRVRWAAVTDTGLVRTNNEDSCIVADLGPGTDPIIPAEGDPPSADWIVGPKGVLLAVSDGMGGQEAGEVASAIAVRQLAAVLDEKWTLHSERDDPAELRNDLRTAVARANRAVLDDVREHPERAGMGATLTAAVVLGRLLLVAHVGDSRCYLLRDGHLKCLTADQSLAEELVRRGIVERDTAAYDARKSVLTRVVGQQGKLEPDAEIASLAAGDRLLVCSDGLYGPVEDEVIAGIMERYDDPADAVARLVEMAKENGAPDNVTCIAGWLSGEGLPSAADLEEGGGTLSVSLDAELVAKAGDETVSMDAVHDTADPLPPTEDGPRQRAAAAVPDDVDFEAPTMTLGEAPMAEAPSEPPEPVTETVDPPAVPVRNVVDEDADTEAMEAAAIEEALEQEALEQEARGAEAVPEPDAPAPGSLPAPAPPTGKPTPKSPSSSAPTPAAATGDSATVALAVAAVVVALVALVFALVAS